MYALLGQLPNETTWRRECHARGGRVVRLPFAATVPATWLHFGELACVLPYDGTAQGKPYCLDPDAIVVDGFCYSLAPWAENLTSGTDDENEAFHQLSEQGKGAVDNILAVLTKTAVLGAAVYLAGKYIQRHR